MYTGGLYMNFDGILNEFMIYSTLFTLNNRIQTFADKEFNNITAKQHFLLTILSLFGDVKPSLKETADVMGCSYQNVKKMADNLEKNGYLRVVRDKLDKRKYNLITTNKYSKFQEEMEKEIKSFFQDLFKGLSQDELKSALGTLSAMEQNLKAAASVA